MTVDAAGVICGSRSTEVGEYRYAPDGSLREVFGVPAPQTTCCAFGGPGLHRLYITTATENWTDEQRRMDPGAGLVYRLETDAVGRPTAPFRPDRAWWSEFTS